MVLLRCAAVGNSFPEGAEGENSDIPAKSCQIPVLELDKGSRICYNPPPCDPKPEKWRVITYSRAAVKLRDRTN